YQKELSCFLHDALPISKSDWVITGEGKTDEQTLQGKLPFVIASMAKEYDVPTILVSGALGGDLDHLYHEFDSVNKWSKSTPRARSEEHTSELQSRFDLV